VKRVLCSLAAMIFAAGCATIMNGTEQRISVSSVPSGAQVSVSGRTFGTTPVAVSLGRKGNHTIKIELAGYKPYDIALSSTVSGWAWGNIVFGGPIGLAVDAVTGGLYVITPESVTASLVKSGDEATLNFRDGTMVVAVVLEPEIGWIKTGQLIRDGEE